MRRDRPNLHPGTHGGHIFFLDPIEAVVRVVKLKIIINLRDISTNLSQSQKKSGCFKPSGMFTEFQKFPKFLLDILTENKNVYWKPAYA